MTRLKLWFYMTFPKFLIKRFRGDTAKKVFFLKQYEATVKRIWGLEFTIDSMRDAKEIVRREYDKLSETLDAAKAAYGKEDLGAEAKEGLEKLIETKSREIEEWKKKVDLSDDSIREVQNQVSAYYEQLPRLEKRIYE